MPLTLNRWAHQESNLGPTGYEPVALPTELWALSFSKFNAFTDCKGFCQVKVLAVYKLNFKLSINEAFQLPTTRRMS